MQYLNVKRVRKENKVEPLLIRDLRPAKCDLVTVCCSFCDLTLFWFFDKYMHYSRCNFRCIFLLYFEAVALVFFCKTLQQCGVYIQQFKLYFFYHCLKYQRYTTSGYLGVGIRKFGFVFTAHLLNTIDCLCGDFKITKIRKIFV